MPPLADPRIVKGGDQVLRNVRGEEHLLLRRYFCAAIALILPFALTLFPYSPRDHVAAPHIDPFVLDSTLSQRAVGIPETDELKEMAQLLANPGEAAQRLPEGSERQDALRQIDGFHWRVAALVARPL